MARTPLDCRPLSNGFSLIEALAVLAVLSITLMIAAPTLSDFSRRQRGIATTNLLVTHLILARANAINHSSATAVCPSDDMTSCLSGSDWTSGWVVFFDKDGNRRPDRPDDIIRSESRPPNAGVSLTSTLGRPQARYLPDGRSSGTNMTLLVCSQKMLLRQVIINNAGRTRIARPNQPTPC